MSVSDPQVESNDFSLLDAARMVKSSVQILLKYKFLILGVFSLFIISAILFANNQPKNYLASSTMMLDNDSKSNGSLLSGLAQGLSLGGTGGGLTENKLIPIAKSKAVQEYVLFDTIEVNGEQDIVINHLMDLELFEHPKFGKLDSKSINTSLKDSISKFVCGVILQEVLSIESSPEGIITVGIKCKNPEIAKAYNDKLLISVSEYFIEKSVAKEQKSLEIVQKRVDSTQSVLNRKQEQLALMKDSRKRMIKVQGYVDEIRLEREIEFLSTMYTEALKNLEISKFNLEVKKPVVTVIDSAQHPLPLIKPNIVLYLIGALLLASFVSVGLIILIRFYTVYYKKA